MEKIYWDGKMDVGLEDLSAMLLQKSQDFLGEAIKCAEVSSNTEIKKLITESSVERIEAVIHIIASDLKDIFYYQSDDIEGSSKGEALSLKMKDWIMLGSAIESILQTFLSIYLHDYKKSNWKQWTDFEFEKVKDKIFIPINELINDGTIKREYGNSMKEAIKDKIKEHTTSIPVDKIMLDELILFYQKNDILDTDDIDQLRYIQSNRNCIHTFAERNIGNWSDLLYSIRFFCYLLDLLLDRLPDVDYY